MRNNIAIKLITVIDKDHLVLYEAQGLVVTNGPLNVDLPFTTHHKREKHDGNFYTKSHIGGGFEPHTNPKEIDKQYAARIITQHLGKIIDKYSALIIIAEPKMLGHIRHETSPQLKQKIVKEINKDMILAPKNIIEMEAFGRA